MSTTTNVTRIPASPAVEIGCGAGTLSVMIRDAHNIDDSAELEYIQSEAGDDAVAVISNPGKRISLESTLLASATVPAKGNTVTLGSVAYLVESCQVRRTRKAARIALTIYKPDNTTWTSSQSS